VDVFVDTVYFCLICAYSGQTPTFIYVNILPRMHESILFYNGILKKIIRISENPFGFLI